MWKLPFHVHGAEAYSEIVFSDPEEVTKRFQDALVQAAKQVKARGAQVGKYLIFRHQVVALPSSLFDQRNVGVGDVPGTDFDENRPKTISFEM